MRPTPLPHVAARALHHVALAAALTFFSPGLCPAVDVTELQGPSPESQATLRRAFSAAQSGMPKQADKLLTDSIGEWQRTRQPADETAALFKTRGVVRFGLGDTAGALSDFSEALRLDTVPGSNPDPAELQRTFQLRANAYRALSRWREEEADLTAAIARLDDLSILESTNPYLYTRRAAARARLGDYSGAVEDQQQAQADYRNTGDKIRRTVAGADLGLALYGQGDEDGAVEQIRATFKSKGLPTTNVSRLFPFDAVLCSD
jgi:tetratricopeptide (TPR) repeat protein